MRRGIFVVPLLFAWFLGKWRGAPELGQGQWQDRAAGKVRDHCATVAVAGTEDLVRLVWQGYLSAGAEAANQVRGGTGKRGGME